MTTTTETPTIDCPACGGSGTCSSRSGYVQAICDVCDGEGRVDNPDWEPPAQDFPALTAEAKAIMWPNGWVDLNPPF